MIIVERKQQLHHLYASFFRYTADSGVAENEYRCKASDLLIASEVFGVLTQKYYETFL
jgi:hypothetical protein